MDFYIYIFCCEFINARRRNLNNVIVIREYYIIPYVCLLLTANEAAIIL